MSDEVSLLHEIDEALRADKAHQFWQRYGKMVLAGCGVIVVLTAISAYWKNHQHEEQMAQTHMMLQAQSLAGSGQYLQAADALAGDKNSSGNPAGLVTLQAAEFYLKAGQRDKAIILLKEIAASPAVDSALRDSAVLRLHALTGSDLAPADGEGRPFALLAMQNKAAGLLKEGKNKEAAVLLKNVMAATPVYSTNHSEATELLQLTGESADK